MTLVDPSPMLARRNRGKAKQIATVLTAKRKVTLWINASRFMGILIGTKENEARCMRKSWLLKSQVMFKPRRDYKTTHCPSDEGNSSNAGMSPDLVQVVC